MKIIGQQIKWDFEVNGDLQIRDKNRRLIYGEKSNGFWVKSEYDSQGNEIYLERPKGHWVKWEYDSQGNELYYENSNGEIRDNRSKPCENKEIVIDGEKYKLVKV